MPHSGYPYLVAYLRQAFVILRFLLQAGNPDGALQQKENLYF